MLTIDGSGKIIDIGGNGAGRDIAAAESGEDEYRTRIEQIGE
jgi:hypothetical protein